MPAVPTDDEQKRALEAKAAQFGLPPPGYWDSMSLHATPQRFKIDTFKKLLREELVDVASGTRDARAREASEVAGSRRTRGSKGDDRIVKPPTKEELAVQKKKEARERRVRKSSSKYLKRKRMSQQPKIDKAKRMVGAALEVFDHETQSWAHTRVNRIQVDWRDNGTKATVKYEITIVDDLERICAPPKWIDLDKVRSYVSQRAEPDPETRKLWEVNEANTAIADARGLLALIDIETRRKNREQKEASDKEKFELARADATRRKRAEAYAEAGGLLQTKAVKAITKKLAKQVIEEMRAGLVEISLRPKTPGRARGAGLSFGRRRRVVRAAVGGGASAKGRAVDGGRGLRGSTKRGRRRPQGEERGAASTARRGGAPGAGVEPRHHAGARPERNARPFVAASSSRRRRQHSNAPEIRRKAVFVSSDPRRGADIVEGGLRLLRDPEAVLRSTRTRRTRPSQRPNASRATACPTCL